MHIGEPQEFLPGAVAHSFEAAGRICDVGEEDRREDAFAGTFRLDPDGLGARPLDRHPSSFSTTQASWPGGIS